MVQKCLDLLTMRTIRCLLFFYKVSQGERIEGEAKEDWKLVKKES